MGFDLLIMRLLSEIDLNDVQYYDGAPPYLVLLSNDFTGVERIIINGFDAPSFILSSNTRLVVQLPEQVIHDKFRSLRVLRYKHEPGFPISLTDWEVGRSPKLVAGFLKLTQNFLRLLLQTPGTDIFRPDNGGGLLAMIGQQVTNKKESIANAAMEAILTTQNQFKQMQSNITNLDPEEKLVYARLEGVNFSPEETMAGVSMSLVNSTGQHMLTDVSDLSKLVTGGGFL